MIGMIRCFVLLISSGVEENGDMCVIPSACLPVGKVVEGRVQILRVSSQSICGLPSAEEFLCGVLVQDASLVSTHLSSTALH